MFCYHVTFVAPFWHMTTTVESEYDSPPEDSDEWNMLVKAASEIIYSTCRFSPLEYATVDVCVEYDGATEEVV